jgi:hypothetical protein
MTTPYYDLYTLAAYYAPAYHVSQDILFRFLLKATDGDQALTLMQTRRYLTRFPHPRTGRVNKLALRVNHPLEPQP